ncbi:MAG: methyltransferase domain-containing protein [Porphyromonadaceae bacterium]|nr:MAG: methyltransferase domain-containing protein [Porphyromonadaceae bacterium]
MATQKDLDAHYTLIDKSFRLSLGEKCAYSCARFDGDFSMTIEEAQLKKHQFVVDACNIKNGTKVLDLGCGWGAFIDYLDKLGAETYGVTLAKGQTDACIQNGLNVIHMDSKDITPETFGKFDVVTAMGSTEHLCSIEQYKAGLQEEIYKTYFKQIADLLPVGGRFYCQTMVFGPNMVKFEDIQFNKTNIWEKEFTNEELIDILCQIFSGSWLPYGKEGIINPSVKHFKVISIDSGRLDYIETIERWSLAIKKFNLKKYLFFASLLPKYLTSKPFREFIQRWKTDANLILFEKEIFEHYRIVFEKVND